MMLRLLTLFVLIIAATSAHAQPRPNVIVILTDDQGWGDLSLHGNTNLATPRIDALAREGAAFERFFVCPVCSPTRAEFLTGRYHPRSGVYSTSAGGERMDLDERTIANLFQDAGYVTAAFGKWHNGMQYPYHPMGRGFSTFYGFCSGHWGNYFSPPLERDGKLTRGDGFIIDDLTNEAIRFIETHRHEPFFAYLPFNTPHSPMQVPERFWKKFADHDLPLRHRDRKENLTHARAALAMCENIDWNVGRLLDRLETLDLADNTIIVYFHDNGPNGNRFNGGMKGRKGSTDEGGVRSPLFVRWPAQVQPGTKVPQIASAIDLLPTLADLSGIPLEGQRALDGKSLKPLLLSPSSPWPDRLLFSHWRNRVSVRNQQFRLDHQGKLFDMIADPGQYRDVRGQHVNVANQMEAAAKRWRAEVLAGYDDDRRPFLIGHPDFPYTQIPARDGQAHGEIRRSNRFPNCSFFTNWRSTDDTITWDVDVPAAGKFAVDLYYTCPAVDVGSAIELRLGDAAVQSRITLPHDPPELGKEHDRFPRVESYVKDFRPLRLGVLNLQPGQGTLELRATHMPGKQVMDFRLLMLTRMDP